VPTVVARIFDPRRADIYRHHGVQTFAPTAWSVSKVIELILSPGLAQETAFGNGEVRLVAARAPVHLIGKSIEELAVPGEIRVALIVRLGKALIPVSGTVIEEGDQVYVAIHQSAVWKFQRMMGWKS